jgi:hypothetical protein
LWLEDHPQHPADFTDGDRITSLLADIGHEVPTALVPNLLTTTLRAPAAALGLTMILPWSWRLLERMGRSRGD